MRGAEGAQPDLFITDEGGASPDVLQGSESEEAAQRAQRDLQGQCEFDFDGYTRESESSFDGRNHTGEQVSPKS